MGKSDLKKEWKHLYHPSAAEISVVEVPPLNFLMVDGAGDPNTAPEYAQAVEALYALSYALKFKVKKSSGEDFAVMPLEGLWWTEDMRLFSVEHKGMWLWTMMILQPEVVTAPMAAETLDEVRKKKGLPALEKVRFETYTEGLAAQVMHWGPYADEAPNIARLHAFIHEQGCALSGKHHEIYLNDPRRTASEKMRTVLRQPMRREG